VILFLVHKLVQKMMFLSIRSGNLNAPKGSNPIIKVENTAIQSADRRSRVSYWRSGQTESIIHRCSYERQPQTYK